MKPRFLILVGLGVTDRLFLAWYARSNYDVESYGLVAQTVLSGQNIYASAIAHRYNYAPVWAYIVSALALISHSSGLSLHFVIGSFMTGVDCVNAALLSRIAGRKAALAYLLNPVAILIIGAHVQFDALAITPLLFALHLRKPKASWAFGVVSLLIKQITLFGVWMLYVYEAEKRAVLWITLAGVAVGLTFIPFLPEGFAGIRDHVVFYRSISGRYGLGLLSPTVSKLIFFLVMIALPFLAKRARLSLDHAMTVSFIAFTALTPGFGEQYLIMPIIWASIFRGPWYWLYTASATFFLLSSPNNLHLPIIPESALLTALNAVWLVAVFWLLSYFMPMGRLSSVRTLPTRLTAT